MPSQAGLCAAPRLHACMHFGVRLPRAAGLPARGCRHRWVLLLDLSCLFRACCVACSMRAQFGSSMRAQCVCSMRLLNACPMHLLNACSMRAQCMLKACSMHAQCMPCPASAFAHFMLHAWISLFFAPFLCPQPCGVLNSVTLSREETQPVLGACPTCLTSFTFADAL